jgi:hypothetical protein
VGTIKVVTIKEVRHKVTINSRSKRTSTKAVATTKVETKVATIKVETKAATKVVTIKVVMVKIKVVMARIKVVQVTVKIKAAAATAPEVQVRKAVTIKVATKVVLAMDKIKVATTKEVRKEAVTIKVETKEAGKATKVSTLPLLKTIRPSPPPMQATMLTVRQCAQYRRIHLLGEREAKSTKNSPRSPLIPRSLLLNRLHPNRLPKLTTLLPLPTIESLWCPSKRPLNNTRRPLNNITRRSRTPSKTRLPSTSPCLTLLRLKTTNLRLSSNPSLRPHPRPIPLDLEQHPKLRLAKLHQSSCLSLEVRPRNSSVLVT